jgi:hypothetical protein
MEPHGRDIQTNMQPAATPFQTGVMMPRTGSPQHIRQTHAF